MFYSLSMVPTADGATAQADIWQTLFKTTAVEPCASAK